MVSLSTPIVLVCILVFSSIFLLCHRWRVATVLICLAIAINIYMEYLPLRVFSSCDNDYEILTIATHNIHSQGEYLDKNRHNPDSLFDILRSLDADVIILQEYDSGRCNRLSTDLEREGYILYQKKHCLQYGENAILSRYPLTDIRFGNDGLTMFSRLQYRGYDINLINCHLCSNNIGEKIIYNDGNADWLHRLPYYILSIEASGKRRAAEARDLRQYIDSCFINQHAVIVAGDFNDVGGSYVIRTIKGKGRTALSDAWWYSGVGIGNTYHGYDFLHFRLDHILFSCHFEACESKVIEQPYSDHEILITKLRIK